MFNSRSNKHEIKEGIVIVSISNLFHILDISRTEEKEKEKEENPLHKTNTRSVFFFEQGLSKDNGHFKRETSRDDNKLKEKESKEIEDNKEQKDIIVEKEMVFKESKDKFETLTTEKEVKFKEPKDSSKILSKISTYRKNFTKTINNNKKHKSSCCDYFFNFVLCNFLLLVFNNCFIWIFNYMFSENKNKSYCFNSNIKEFGICIESEYCPSSGNHDFIYINDESISNIDVKEEIQNINSKYLKFFVHESVLFSSLNKKYLKSESTFSKYSVTIITTKNENYLFKNAFRIGCANYLMEILLMKAMAIILGNIIFGLMADTWGRKKMLIITVFIEIIGGYILSFSSFYIQNLKNINNISEIITNDFLSEIIFNINEHIALNNFYKIQFNKLKQEIYETLFIKERFQRFKIFPLFGMFLIFLSNSSIKTISLSYLLENALTEETMSLYYLFFVFSTPFSIFLSSLLIIYIDSFYIPILIISIFQLIIIILIIIFFYESQRINFEYCFYSRITEFTEYILGKEELKSNYRVKDEDLKNNVDMSVTVEKENMNFFGIYYSIDDYRIQSELNNEKINENISFKDSILYSKYYLYKQLYINKKIEKPSSKNIIERYNIFNNPFYLLKLMKKDKQIKKKATVIFSFIISLSIVINLTLQRITSNFLIGREKIINKAIFGTYLFSYIILIIIILFPFVHYLVKCFGLYIILFPSLIIITISTGLFEIICFLNPEGDFRDITKFHDGNNDKLMESVGNYLLPFVYIISFCFISLEYVLYFFILKLTKTIYRCSFLGNCQIIYDFCYIISFGLEKYISGGYYYACIFSIISTVNALFINSSEDSLNIGEMRDIKFDETKTNEK